MLPPTGSFPGFPAWNDGSPNSMPVAPGALISYMPCMLDGELERGNDQVWPSVSSRINCDGLKHARDSLQGFRDNNHLGAHWALGQCHHGRHVSVFRAECWGGNKFELLCSTVLATIGLWERLRDPVRGGLDSGEK